MESPSKKTLVLFDVDGTLVYSKGIDSRCFARAYENIYGKIFPSLDWRNYPHVSDHTIFGTAIQQHFGRAIEEEEVAIFQNHYINLLKENRKQIPEQHHIIPGAREMLKHLSVTATFEVGFATGGWAAPAHLKLNHVGIATEGHVLVGADNKVSREDILTEAIREATHKNEQHLSRIVYVGDAIWDVHTTRNLAIDLVGIRYRGDREVLENEGVNVVIQNYVDLEEFMEGLSRARPPGRGAM